MKQILLTASVMLTLNTSLFAQKSEQKGVVKAFENYKSAILNDKGEEAVKHVDSRTITYYGDMLALVKTADRATVEERSILDKLMVLSIRHRTSREEILGFDGRSMLVYAIESGMVGKNSVTNISIGDVIIEGDFAKGQLESNGEKALIYFHFYKEEGQWKIDLTSIFPMSTAGFQKMADDSGKEENAFLFSILEMITGTKPGDTIWDPVK